MNELSFCLTPRHMKIEVILYDVEKFFRWLWLKDFFQEEYEEEERDAENLFHHLSSWIPPKRGNAALEAYVYIKKTKTDMESHLNDLQAKRCKYNLLLNKDRL